jgi:single-strand DNA-binding protein
MAKDLNKVMIIGNLTRDPELKTTPSGQQVVNVGVATNRSWKNAEGESQEAAEFHNVEAWGKLAEIIAQYLTKGRRAYFEGRLQTDQWEDKESGAKRSKTKIVAQDMILLDSRGSQGGAPASGGGAADQTPAQPTEAEAPQAGAKGDGKAGGKSAKDEEASLDDIPF